MHYPGSTLEPGGLPVHRKAPQAIGADVLAFDRPHRAIVRFLTPPFRDPLIHTRVFIKWEQSLCQLSLSKAISKSCKTSYCRGTISLNWFTRLSSWRVRMD
jgi:hypothetical protein